jgi:hypothetical protein
MFPAWARAYLEGASLKWDNDRSSYSAKVSRLDMRRLAYWFVSLMQWAKDQPAPKIRDDASHMAWAIHEDAASLMASMG